jgi:pimeloyl-ACP methyl ester carboxylesterase
MKLLDWLIRRKEEELAAEDDPFRNAGPFRLGSFSSITPQEFSNVDQMAAAVAEEMRNVEAFYGTLPVDEHAFVVSRDRLAYKTAFPNGTKNDMVDVNVIRASPKGRAVIIVPHWNSTASSYTAMGRLIARCGFAVFVITLPHHSPRGGDSNQQVANDFLNADLGVAIRSVRQSVADINLLTGWLEKKGYEKIYLIGVSLGSCIASLATAFDRRIRKTALLLTAGDFAETVWDGRATAHIRETIERHIELSDLKKIWAILSPLNFVKKFAENKADVLVVSGRRDQVVPFRLAADFVRAMTDADVQVTWRVLPCGHYTLGVFPFNITALLFTLRFLN